MKLVVGQIEGIGTEDPIEHEAEIIIHGFHPSQVPEILNRSIEVSIIAFSKEKVYTS